MTIVYHFGALWKADAQRNKKVAIVVIFVHKLHKSVINIALVTNIIIIATTLFCVIIVTMVD